MANKKAPGKSSKVVTKAATKSASKASVKKVSALREDERVEVEASAHHPAPSEAEATAFGAQISEAAAEKRGQETKASGVIRDARAWVPIIDRVILSGALVRYSRARFAYFLRLLDALARAVDGAGKRGAGAARDLAEARAREVRTMLTEVLDEVVLGDDAAIAELAAALGTTTTPDELLSSLRALLSLAEAWRSKSDERSVALVESACLRQDDVDAARVAADALATAIRDKTHVGVERLSDTAAVNRLEGRVTFEMSLLMRAFNQAAARGVGVRLAPGPATRRVLGSKKTPKVAAPS
jgi:hypothetical protein